VSVMSWRIGLRGNPDRGMNRALGMENLYGSCDHLWFRSREDAERVAQALTATDHPAFIVPPKVIPPPEDAS
jgi:hypothetical protein